MLREDARMIVDACLDGIGLCSLPEDIMAECLADGRLVRVRPPPLPCWSTPSVIDRTTRMIPPRQSIQKRNLADARLKSTAAHVRVE